MKGDAGAGVDMEGEGGGGGEWWAKRVGGRGP